MAYKLADRHHRNGYVARFAGYAADDLAGVNAAMSAAEKASDAASDAAWELVRDDVEGAAVLAFDNVTRRGGCWQLAAAAYCLQFDDGLKLHRAAIQRAADDAFGAAFANVYRERSRH